MNKERIDAIYNLLVKTNSDELLEVFKLFNIGMLVSFNLMTNSALLEKIEKLEIGGTH